MKKPKVVNVCLDDYANYSHDNARSLQSVGIDCQSFKVQRHPFGYTSQCKVVPRHIILQEIKKADIVQLMHTDNHYLADCINLKKKFVVYHTGSRYRENSENFNSFFDPHVFKTFTDQCEFLKLGAKKIEYVATAIDVNYFAPRKRELKSPYTIGHFPSNASVKGTEAIISMLGDVRHAYRLNYSENKIKHDLQMKRMADCDIYIELFKPFLRGKEYGCFGVTAFEAAAMGKVVVTNNKNRAEYSKAYGSCALMIANTEEEFVNTVENLLLLPEKKLKELQDESRRWIIEKHSFEANGNRLKNLLEI